MANVPQTKPPKKKGKSQRKIEKYQYRLYSQGFVERALSDLHQLAAEEQRPPYQRAAARALVSWYTEQRTPEDARKALELLQTATEGETNLSRLQQAAVMEAECQLILNDPASGFRTIEAALEKGPEPNLYLSAANLENSLPARLQWINQALDYYNISPISCMNTYNFTPSNGNLQNHQPNHNVNTGSHNHSNNSNRPEGYAHQHSSLSSTYHECSYPPSLTLFDQLTADTPGPKYQGPPLHQAPTVTVIMAAYNAAAMIGTALSSLLNQTWPHLEIIVVDDGSTDSTAEVVEDYLRNHSRGCQLQLIRCDINSGPYVARNMALKKAQGEFVTCHDADDWSHPQKIERQVLHLLHHQQVIGNTSEQARLSPELMLYRRGRYGVFCYRNTSSFMFRRTPVAETFGYWDSVRFAADDELIRRIRKVFGKQAYADLATGPLAFMRHHPASLTENQIFGFGGFHMGARREYLESLTYHHRTAPHLYYQFPMTSRPFPAPEPMWINREAPALIGKRRHFDVIIASEFRFRGGTSASNAEEIKAQSKAGLRTGLIHLSRYEMNPKHHANEKIRQLIDGEQVQKIVYGEKVSCDCLIVKHPTVLQEWQKFVPDVQTPKAHVVINQAPREDYGPQGRTFYHLPRCQHHLEEYFGLAGTWHPIGPLLRDILHQHHSEELSEINLSPTDWVEIINIDEWRRSSRPTRSSQVRIGRHTRDDYFKWPPDPAALLAAYPEDDAYEVHILGGAQQPKQILGYLPSNWQVLEFGEIPPRQFLSSLDVFVYFTHPDMVESFGRAIIEAMAVGVPVILPPAFRKLFGEAAIYTEPAGVRSAIDVLMADDTYYQEQVEKALHYVEDNFGYSQHLTRIKS